MFYLLIFVLILNSSPLLSDSIIESRFDVGFSRHTCILPCVIIPYHAICQIWFGLIWFGLVWFGLVWFDLVWFNLIWFVWFSLFTSSTLWKLSIMLTLFSSTWEIMFMIIINHLFRPRSSLCYHKNQSWLSSTKSAFWTTWNHKSQEMHNYLWQGALYLPSTASFLLVPPLSTSSTTTITNIPSICLLFQYLLTRRRLPPEQRVG